MFEEGLVSNPTNNGHLLVKCFFRGTYIVGASAEMTECITR